MAEVSSTHPEYVGDGYSVKVQHCEHHDDDGTVCDEYLGYNYPSSFCSSHQPAPGPVVTNVRKIRGIAGQYQISATVQYPGEEPSTVAFVGYDYGHGPIVMVLASGSQTWVSPEVLDRLGRTLTEDWVRAFFA